MRSSVYGKQNTLYSKNSVFRKTWTEVKKNKFVYFLLFPSVLLVVLFNYVPLWGLKIAFQDYNIYNPARSVWVGLSNFKFIINSNETILAILNTFYVSMLELVIGFPAPIIFALMLNELRDGFFKRLSQTISYLPHFMSWISVIGIATAMYAKYGPINDLIVFLTGNETRTLFLAQQNWVVPNIIILGLWKSLGWSSIVYLAAISGVDASLYEAARLDGAGRLKQTWYITLPTILPTVIIMLIWRCGSLFMNNFELIYGLQNAYINFEVIQTIIFKQGIEGANYQMTTAFGLFQGLINFIILYFVNYFAKKTTDICVF